jgi:hypothetical protein
MSRWDRSHLWPTRPSHCLEEPVSAIPLRVFITPFAERGVKEPAKWSCDAASEAIVVVNAIWSKANVQFSILDCVDDKPLDIAKSSRSDDLRVLNVLSFRHPAGNAVHIYLINPVANLAAGGSSYSDSDPEAASFVQWYYKTKANARAWAHELGHLMSLDHVDIDYSDNKQASLRSNLMTKGLTLGTDLTPQQIEKVKASKLVKRFAS